jgi:FkbM family methyltransferase
MQIGGTLNVIRNDLVRTLAKPGQGGMIVDYHGILFYVNNEATATRAIHALAKEPDTIKWIDQFERDAIFWDVGANVGVYSLYAAKMKDANVLAFEPVFFNYYVFNRSIQANVLDRKVRAFAFAIGDATRFDDMYLADLQDGSALHTYGVPAVDGTNEKFRQAAACFSIDDLVEKHGLAAPQHLKIDVDGFESRVLEGAIRTLARPSLRTVMIELAVSGSEDAVQTKILNAGLEFVGRFHRLDSAPVCNHLFARQGEAGKWRKSIYESLDKTPAVLAMLDTSQHAPASPHAKPRR